MKKYRKVCLRFKKFDEMSQIMLSLLKAKNVYQS